MKTLAIIGGSGLEKLIGEHAEKHEITAPENVSFEYFIVPISGMRAVFVPRHGDEHQNLPLDVPYEEIFAHLLEENIEAIISFSATGTLDETVKLANEKSFVVVSDFMRGYGFRPISARQLDNPHADMSIPFNERLRVVILKAGGELGYTMTPRGIYVHNEGHAFESKAEIAALNAFLSHNKVAEAIRHIRDSLACITNNAPGSGPCPAGLQENIDALSDCVTDLYFPGMEHLTRKGAQVGMTAVREAILAAEYKIPYALIACPVNLAAGMSSRQISHENDTLRVIRESEQYINDLALKTIEKLRDINLEK